jgi:diaminopimelate epimerase
MHGLGNDFMIIDARESAPKLNPALIKILSNRHLGVGFDQLAIIYETVEKNVSAYVKFWNSDGSLSATCGNATRCIARMLMNEKQLNFLSLLTDHGTLYCKNNSANIISVNMGKPGLLWTEIPLLEDCNTLHLPIDGDPIATSMGNPHCTFFVPNINTCNINSFGKKYETHKLFPQKTNVQIAQVIEHGIIKIKVWERGVGQTMASGSSACAVAVAASRRGLSGEKNTIILDGGELGIFWADDGVWMSGETAYIYDGEISEEFLLKAERIEQK